VELLRNSTSEVIGGASGVLATLAVMDPFDIQALFPQLILALGAALVGGNGLALWHQHKGKRPEGLGELRVGRARWLIVVGLVMMVWGLATLLT